MTIQEFAKGFLEGRYCFRRPKGALDNNKFHIFVNALDPFVWKNRYKWGYETFESYCFSHSPCKFVDIQDGCCTGMGAIPDGYKLIDYRKVEIVDYAKELGKLLNGFIAE